MEESTKALQVRFPENMYNRLARNAKINRRSLNAEIVFCLEEYFSEEQTMVLRFSTTQEKCDMVIKKAQELGIEVKPVHLLGLPDK